MKSLFTFMFFFFILGESEFELESIMFFFIFKPLHLTKKQCSLEISNPFAKMCLSQYLDLASFYDFWHSSSVGKMLQNNCIRMPYDRVTKKKVMKLSRIKYIIIEIESIN